MSLLKKGDTVALTACSNGLDLKAKDKINELVCILENFGLKVKISSNLYKDKDGFNGNGKEKAEIFMQYINDKNVKALFDVSGGDMCNAILPYLDYEVIKKSKKSFFGYSDLSVIINAMYAKSQFKSYLYQVRNLVLSDKEVQCREFYETFFKGQSSLMNFKYNFISGSELNGEVIGGNIRCLLKLAGTKYMPDFSNKILFLESLSGNMYKMASFLEQCNQIGIFNNLRGIILGTFTEMEKNNSEADMIELLKRCLGEFNIPIVKTFDIGHGSDSKALIIGGKINLKKYDKE